MKKIAINLDNCKGFFNENEYSQEYRRACEMKEKLVEGKGAGAEFTGWLDLPENYDREEFDRIKNAARKIRESSDYVVNIGIGGSYLGVKALDEALELSKGETKILYAGNSLSGREASSLMDKIRDKDVSLIAISKSGTTTEPAVAFRLLRNFMVEKYGDKSADRIFIVTDKEKGALGKLADENGYERFTIPSDIGGRYSVLSPVGLLPLAAAGADIDRFMEGAAFARKEFLKQDKSGENMCAAYAAARNILYGKGKSIEILAAYEDSLRYFMEWWKQLYGESEGKQGKGIFPASVVFTADLHSMGQYIQQGRRDLFETVLAIEEQENDIEIPDTGDDTDGIDYIAGMKLDDVNRIAMEATVKAHTEGGVPNILIRIPGIDENNMGQLIFFFEMSCAISGYLLGINPFDQPGVEAYKTEMFRMLGKPGY